ncbi:MAG TPA: hypothetical protein VFF95_10325 [Candidatus Binatus sp.]|nr:hypothetical protein [Candidatus Binatus sp.]
MSKEALRSLTAFSLRITAAISLPFGAALVIASLMFESVSVGLWAAAAMTFWIIQETLRRGLMAHLRFRDASWGDTISYLGQTVLVLLLALTGWLSVKTAFCAMAITSLSAAGIQASQLGIWKRQAQEAFSWLGDYWNLGRWMLLNNFAGIFSVQFFPWALALFHGTSAAGAFQALTNVLGVTNPIVFSTVSLILPACARACKDNGVEAAWKIAKRYAIQSGLLLSPFFVATLIWPERILGLFYGHHSTYIGFTSELRMLTIAGVINYLAVVMAALFSAIEDSRTTFLVLLVSAFGSFLVGAPLVAWKGVWGAAGALLIGALLRTTISRILLHRNWHASKKEIPQCQGS